MTDKASQFAFCQPQQLGLLRISDVKKAKNEALLEKKIEKRFFCLFFFWFKKKTLFFCFCC